MISDFGHEISWNQYNFSLLKYLKILFTPKRLYSYWLRNNLDTAKSEDNNCYNEGKVLEHIEPSTVY